MVFAAEVVGEEEGAPTRGEIGAYGVGAATLAARRRMWGRTVSVVWGVLIAAIGVLFSVWGRTRSGFVVYRVLAARSRMMWGDRVHDFYQVVGVILVVVGLLVALLG